MKQETVKHLGDGATTLAVSTGMGSSWLGFLNHNAAGIGVILTFIFGCIGVLFYYLNWKKTVQAEHNAKEIEDLKSQLAGISQRKQDKKDKG